MVGDTDGFSVGVDDGRRVGDADGAAVGATVGNSVGAFEGSAVGASVGASDGTAVGDTEQVPHVWGHTAWTTSLTHCPRSANPRQPSGSGPVKLVHVGDDVGELVGTADG